MTPVLAVCALLAASAVTAAGIAWWVRRRWLVVSIDGDSMRPTLRPGDRVVARRTTLAGIHRGDVVVVRTPAGWPTGPPAGLLVKRAVALPGDPAPPGLPSAPSSAPSAPPDRHRLVPPGHLVLFGDNPPASRDSRQVGYFTEADLLGVVVAPRRFTGRRDPT
ncbi:S26 family signal peptidase [Polymorphospora sp. NPDC051019]|uniref:S26 family signal peptidase n=1 Tax=Polymorphospora sp. NPDC051019 TaxID=3155725 RepID=UPI00342117D8